MAPVRTVLAGLVLAGLMTSCNGQTDVVIGRIGSERNEVEMAPLCDAPVLGPNGMFWCTIADSPASASWVAPPSAAEARVRVDSTAAAAGMAFSFDEVGTVRDLSVYDHLTFRGEFPAGVPFDVIVGRGRTQGCSFQRPTGAEQGVYAIDLTNPAWCSPSLCEYDLHASGAYFLTSTATSAEFAIQSVEAQKQSGLGAGPVSAMQAKIAVGDYCWFPFAWYEGTSATMDQATSSVVHVRAAGAQGKTAGVAFELDEGFDASAYARLEVEATITPQGQFLVQLVRERRGMTWRLQAIGSGTYVVDLRSSAVSFGEPAMQLSDANRVEFATEYQTGGTLDITITAVRFVP